MHGVFVCVLPRAPAEGVRVDARVRVRFARAGARASRARLL